MLKPTCINLSANRSKAIEEEFFAKTRIATSKDTANDD